MKQQSSYRGILTSPLSNTTDVTSWFTTWQEAVTAAEKKKRLLDSVSIEIRILLTEIVDLAP